MEAKEVGVRVLQALQVPYLTVAASDPRVVAALSWGRTLDPGPSDPSGLPGLVVESFSDPFLVVLGQSEMLDWEIIQTARRLLEIMITTSRHIKFNTVKSLPCIGKKSPSPANIWFSKKFIMNCLYFFCYLDDH